MKTLIISDLKKSRCLLIVLLALMLLLTIVTPCLAEGTTVAADSASPQSLADSGPASTIIDKNGEEISTTPDPLLVAANQTPIKPEKWGWLIGIYLFLGGMGAGAYLISFLAERGFFSQTGALKKAGYYIGAPAVAIGAFLLVFDLGQGLHKPWLILRMFLNFSSVMTWGIYILSLFIVVGLIKGFLAWRNAKSPSVLSWIGAILALSTMAYTGLLLYAAKAIPFWETPLIPILFIVSALSTGLSATLLVSHFLDKRAEKKETKKTKVAALAVAVSVSVSVEKEAAFTEPLVESKIEPKTEPKSELKKTTITHLVLVCLESILFLAFIIPALTGAKGESATLAANAIISGSMALFFWVLFVGIGLAFPAVIYVLKLLRKRREVSTRPGKVLDLLCDGAVLVGGLTLRCLIVFAAFPIWNGLLR